MARIRAVRRPMRSERLGRDAASAGRSRCPCPPDGQAFAMLGIDVDGGSPDPESKLSGAGTAGGGPPSRSEAKARGPTKRGNGRGAAFCGNISAPAEVGLTSGDIRGTGLFSQFERSKPPMINHGHDLAVSFCSFYVLWQSSSLVKHESEQTKNKDAEQALFHSAKATPSRMMLPQSRTWPDCGLPALPRKMVLRYTPC